MAKFLANENVPGEVVEAARQAGHDWHSSAKLRGDLQPGDSGFIGRFSEEKYRAQLQNLHVGLVWLVRNAR